MNSAIYEGTIRHRRFSPVPHEFTYRMFMMYVDLAELPDLFDRYWLWSARRAAPAWFRRADYHGDPAEPLDQAIRDLVEGQTGNRPPGPIRMLTHLRYFGFIMNPVTFYYCFDATGTAVDTVVAEITNTPWKERFAYVLPRGGAGSGDRISGGRMQFTFAKEFHVSPFMGMDHDYQWRFTEPGTRLGVHMENWKAGKRVFDATMNLAESPIRSGTLAGVLARHPFMTARVGLRIYWQALRLRLKRAPVHTHPAGKAA